MTVDLLMWTNPKTGKGWTDEEEAAFAAIQDAGQASRSRAIQLWKRCGKDAAKAVRIARWNAPTQAQARHRMKTPRRLSSPVDAISVARIAPGEAIEPTNEVHHQ